MPGRACEQMLPTRKFIGVLYWFKLLDIAVSLNSVEQDGYPSPLTEVRLFDPFNDVVFQHVIILNYFSELNQCCYLLYCLFVRFLKGMRGGSGGGRACEQINSPFMR